MKIGFTGTQSVGKSTIVKELMKLPQFEGYHFSTERSKYLRDLGIPLNGNSTVNGQLIFMAERASELMYDNLITDRTIWDVCSFTFVSTEIDWYTKTTLVTCSSILTEQYDVIFYISPEGMDIEDNGIREINSELRNKIDYGIKSLLDNYPPKKLVQISGTIEERIEQVLNVLKQ
jgi:nicotinamide riboside kinase